MRQRALFATALLLLLAGCTQPTPTATPTVTQEQSPTGVAPDTVPTSTPSGPAVDISTFQLVMVELYDESLIGADVVGTCLNDQCNEGTLPVYEDDFFDPIPDDEIFMHFGTVTPTRAELRLLPWT